MKKFSMLTVMGIGFLYSDWSKTPETWDDPIVWPPGSSYPEWIDQ